MLEWGPCSILLLLAAAATAGWSSAAPHEVRVGAIRWDNWGGLAAGGSAIDTVHCMSPERYHWKVPFCGQAINRTAVDFDCTTPAVMRQELILAARAGISFWAFVQYPEDDALSAALRNYLAIPTGEKSGITFSALIEVGRLPKTPTGPRWLEFVARYDGYFARADYERVSLASRPLVFLFGNYEQVVDGFGSTTAFEKLLAAWTGHCTSQGLPAPWFVWQDAYNDTFSRQLRTAGSIQSRSSYALGDGQTNGSFSGQLAQDLQKWDDWAANGDDVIPLASTGWDPRDRADGCARWLPNGEGTHWTQAPTPAQVVTSVAQAVRWACNRSTATTPRVLVYAWNENSEGGWLVPTLGEGERRVDALAKYSQGRWLCHRAGAGQQE